MIDPDTLLSALVSAMQGNPTLVAATGASSANITGYSPSYPTAVDLYAAIRAMNPPSILVAWTGTQIGNRSNGIEHQYSAFLRPNGKVATMFSALREGTVTTSGLKFKRHIVSVGTHPVDVQGCFTRQVVVGEAILEYHEVPLRITERGVDS